jgi:hypothetical protein
MLDALGDMVCFLCRARSGHTLMPYISTRKSHPKCCRTLLRRMLMGSPLTLSTTTSQRWICVLLNLSSVLRRNSWRWSATHTTRMARLISISEFKWSPSSALNARARRNDGTVLGMESYRMGIGCYFGTGPAAPILLVGGLFRGFDCFVDASFYVDH